MKILVSGATGLIGSELRRACRSQGHTTAALVRPSTRRKNLEGEEQVVWDIAAGRLDASRLRGFDAVVHLAGENLIGGRWTEEQKRRILDSRVQSTRLLAEKLASLDEPRPALICASGVNYYGSHREEVLDEESPPGTGFLAEVCQAWEAAADPARAQGIRVVHARFAPILSPKGGMLRLILPMFRFGLGAKLGDGRQFMSWVALEDAVGALLHILGQPSLFGPVNVCAPEPVLNERFTQALGEALGRPTFLRVPKFAIRGALGELGQETVLSALRVLPRKLEQSGYLFRCPTLEVALREMLGD